MRTRIDEELVVRNFESQSKALTKKYEKIFNEVAKSDNFTKSSRPFTNMDAYSLGMMLEQYSQYERWMRESSAADLGTLPNIAVDLIATSYAVSVAPLLASLQPLGEQQGIVYFKQVTAGNTRADLVAGDKIFDAREGIKNSVDEYSSELIENEILGATVNNQTHYDFTAQGIPIRSNIPITVTAEGIPNAEGVFLNGKLLDANGIWTGDINYTNGDINIDFAQNPGAGHRILITYHQDFERAADVPTIEMSLTSTDIMAQVQVIKQNLSTLKAFQFGQRFGKVAEDEALMDLSGAFADAESRMVIKGWKKMADWVEVNYPGNVLVFSKTVPAGQSEFEYRQGFRYRLVSADSAININSGRGAANRYIAGHQACEYIAALPKFTAAAVNITAGPHVYGYLDGKPVIRTTYVDTDEIIAGYLNPQSPFEAPEVVGTYMPVFITNTIQSGSNPLNNQRAIASWKGFKNVVPQFIKKIRLVP